MQDTMNCIYKIDIEYCLLQALYEVETNQILQLQFYFPYFRYKYMYENGVSIQCRRFIWRNQVNTFFFLSKSLMLFIKRTSKLKLHVFLVYEKSLNKNPALFYFLIFIIVLKITKTHHSFSLLSTYSGISNFDELDWTGLLISFHSALHNYGCLDGVFCCCCYIHI